MYTDCDTPSGDASLLQLHNPGQGDSDNILSSTAISTMSCTARPDPNLSNIRPQISLSVEDCPAEHLPTAPAGAVMSEPSISTVYPQACLSVMSEPSSAISCDLCGQVVKGRAYLSQHRNKKKCMDRQRVQKEAQQSLEVSAARSLSLRVSESDNENSAGISKVNIKTIKDFSELFFLDLGTLPLWYNVWKQGSTG